MKLKTPNRREHSGQNHRLTKAYDKLDVLLKSINERGIPMENSHVIHAKLMSIYSFYGSDKQLTVTICKTYGKILSHLADDLNLVQKFHYQNRWMAFGIVTGVLFSYFSNILGEAATWNSMGMGISMGLLFGMVAGKNRDEKAFKKGLQLDLKKIDIV